MKGCVKMLDVKNSFITLSQALRKVYEAKRKKLEALPQLEQAYQDLKKNYPKWLVRDVERFVAKLYRSRKPKQAPTTPEAQATVGVKEAK